MFYGNRKALTVFKKPLAEFNSDVDKGSLYSRKLLIQHSFTFIIMFSVWNFYVRYVDSSAKFSI
jgi:hypothetical protein